MPPREHQKLLMAALEREGEAQRLLLDGQRDEAAAAFAEVAELYRRSWEEAPERAYGRLVGMLKASVFAGDWSAARYVREALGDRFDSPASAYAVGLAALTGGDDELAGSAAGAMTGDSEAFARTGRAISALARHDEGAYREALTEIVADFEAREEHLTGVAIADTAAMLEVLAARRGMAGGVTSALLPAVANGH